MSNIHEKRIRHIEEMLAEQPMDSFLLFALAKEYDALGKIKSALETYDQLLENDAEYLGTYYHLAELLYRMDLSDRAHSIATQGIKVAKKQGAQKDLAELIQLRDNF